MGGSGGIRWGGDTLTISAKIVADSVSPSGVRLTTLELCYHRYIHSELMTHRMFSRNAASSRAIPVEKMLKQVEENPAMPIHWGKNQTGMQAREECNNLIQSRLLGFDLQSWDKEEWWELLAEQTAAYAWDMAESGYHKQVVNRLLEPFQYIKVILSATEFDNFFQLRDHEDAQPEMAALARCMKEAMDNSVPNKLEHGEWHLPYIQVDDCLKTTTDHFVKLSVARCARVSYLNHDNSSPDVERDIQLADKLLEAGHMSPMEHQATPMMYENGNFLHEFDRWEKGITHVDRDTNFWSGNFRGWIQYRQLLAATR